MRLNKFLAQVTKLSRRKADEAIAAGLIQVNTATATTGQQLHDGDRVRFNGQEYCYEASAQKSSTTILLNKPVGYVCSRDGQGSKTVYNLLPTHLHHLHPAGRLDKDSSGLLVMTDDGILLNQLTHPTNRKQKIYRVTLNRPLSDSNRQLIEKDGVRIGDERPSRFVLLPTPNDRRTWLATLEEGRNRQIRRTFEALGIEVTALHRLQFGPYQLGDLPSGKYRIHSI